MFLKRLLLIVLIAAILLGASVSAITLSFAIARPPSYGVFLGVPETEILTVSEGYELIIVDGLSFSDEIIGRLKARGQTVYSYLSIGSLETYRDYYSDYSHLALAPYENWPEEYWVDVSDAGWRSLLADSLADSLIKKGIEGFFLDNADVYFMFPTEEIFSGLVSLLTELRRYNVPLILNGGNVFVSRLIEEGRADLIDGVNQESVFSIINDYDRDLFSRQPSEDHAYFKDYLSFASRAGLDVFLLEYTLDEDLIQEILSFCRRNDYGVFIASSVALDGR